MALEFIGGALFTLLYDGVKQAMSKSNTFKTLLGDLKSTLDSLEPRDIQQIGEHNVELGLRNEEIESLKIQMEEGVKLVGKLSSFRMWNYCCLSDYTEQIVELDRALKRLLAKLKMQEARDVKEVLFLARLNRDKLDELNRRQSDIHKLLQQIAGGATENLASESTVETVPEQSQGNGGGQVASFDGGTSLQAVFAVLFDVVIEVKDKTAIFNPVLEDLKSTLDSLEPLIEEMAKHSKVLDLPKGELEDFRIQMEKGVELIRECSKLHLMASCKQDKYTDKLLGLDESLQRLLSILKIQLARDVKKTLVSVKNIEAVIKQIERSGVVQEQIQSKGWGALPEPLSPTVESDIQNVQGTRGVNETLASVWNTMGSDEQIVGSGVVQKQSEIIGTSEDDSKNRDSNTSSSTGSQFLKEASPRMDKSQTGWTILETSNLRVFIFAELKAATRNFRADTVLGEGVFGRVYKGWMDEKTLAPSKVGNGLPVAIKKLNSESVQGLQDWLSEVKFLGTLSHPNLVKLLGYCWEESELLLVYEFMRKGSLENNLFKRGSGIEPLSWENRLRIAIGAARGLAFLHNLEKPVIFRDFRTSNILLDENYNAKLSDFGLATLGPTGDRLHASTVIMGTYGYCAPEYIATGHLYVKCDVYTFGVVLLEILTGLRAYDRNRPVEQQNLVDWAKPDLSHRRKWTTIMDVRMEGQYSFKAASQTAHLTLKCLALDPESRPSMKEVVEALEKVQAIKKKPMESKRPSRHSTAGSRLSDTHV